MLFFFNFFNLKKENDVFKKLKLFIEFLLNFELYRNKSSKVITEAQNEFENILKM